MGVINIKNQKGGLTCVHKLDYDTWYIFIFLGNCQNVPESTSGHIWVWYPPLCRKRLHHHPINSTDEDWLIRQATDDSWRSSASSLSISHLLIVPSSFHMSWLLFEWCNNISPHKNNFIPRKFGSPFSHARLTLKILKISILMNSQ